MKHGINVQAIWDEDAHVWVATSDDIDGLSIEADTLEELTPKVTDAIRELLELNGSVFHTADIPIHIRSELLASVPNPGM